MSTTKNADQLSTPTGSEKSTKSDHIGWAGVHCSFIQSANLRDYILLNSNSTESIFCNEAYVSNIHMIGESLVVLTNGGISATSLILGHTGSTQKRSPTSSASPT
eukprot:5471186-Ditylum_brightwellii.AAC.1